MFYTAHTLSIYLFISDFQMPLAPSNLLEEAVNIPR